MKEQTCHYAACQDCVMAVETRPIMCGTPAHMAYFVMGVKEASALHAMQPQQCSHSLEVQPMTVLSNAGDTSRALTLRLQQDHVACLQTSGNALRISRRPQTSMHLYRLRLQGWSGGATGQMCLLCLSPSSTSTPRSTGIGVSIRLAFFSWRATFKSPLGRPLNHISGAIQWSFHAHNVAGSPAIVLTCCAARFLRAQLRDHLCALCQAGGMTRATRWWSTPSPTSTSPPLPTSATGTPGQHHDLTALSLL